MAANASQAGVRVHPGLVLSSVLPRARSAFFMAAWLAALTLFCLSSRAMTLSAFCRIRFIDVLIALNLVYIQLGRPSLEEDQSTPILRMKIGDRVLRITLSPMANLLVWPSVPFGGKFAGLYLDDSLHRHHPSPRVGLHSSCVRLELFWIALVPLVIFLQYQNKAFSYKLSHSIQYTIPQAYCFK